MLPRHCVAPFASEGNGSMYLKNMLRKFVFINAISLTIHNVIFHIFQIFGHLACVYKQASHV